MTTQKAPKEIAEAAISLFNKQITDSIFLIIQNDRELMHDYLRTVNELGHASVNRVIGRFVKDRYNLVNSDYREKEPECTLISSYQEFK